MNTQKNAPAAEQSEQNERSESSPAAEKKPFVEPAVSVPVDVLEATALFQSPTVDTTATN